MSVYRENRKTLYITDMIGTWGKRMNVERLKKQKKDLNGEMNKPGMSHDE